MYCMHNMVRKMLTTLEKDGKKVMHLVNADCGKQSQQLEFEVLIYKPDTAMKMIESERLIYWRARKKMRA